MNNFSGKRVAVIGAGRSGCAAAGALLRRGAQVALYDRKPSAELTLALPLAAQGVALHAETEAPPNLQGYDLVIVSPGVPPSHPIFALAEQADVPLWSEIELAYHISPAPIIAITGTNGKTTTTMLIYHLLRTMGLKARLCGNIAGTEDDLTLTEAAEAAAPDEWLVAEVSSFQLLHTHAFRPRIAVITNIREDHLDYHGSWEAYALAKAKILANLGAGDWAVLNGEDEGIRKMLTLTPQSPLSHRVGEGGNTPSLSAPSPQEQGQGGEDSSPSPTLWERGQGGEGSSASPTPQERGQGGEGRIGYPKHPDLQVSPQIIEMARTLRKRETPSEQILWRLLRNRQLGGFKFRRQHPIGGFIADFYCHEAQLIVEIDGAIHAEPTQHQRDQVREQVLSLYGLACLRFTNEEVKKEAEQVLQRILYVAWERVRRLRQPSPPTPLSRNAGEGEMQGEGASFTSDVSGKSQDEKTTYPSPTPQERGQRGEGGSPSPTLWERGQGGEGSSASPTPQERGQRGEGGSPSPTPQEQEQGGEGSSASPTPQERGQRGEGGSASPTPQEQEQGGEGGSASPTPQEQEQGGEGKPSVIFFTTAHPIVLLKDGVLNLAETPMPALHGKHNLENALAAAHVAALLGGTVQPLREAFATFKGVPHRMEFVGEWAGVRYINNSMCTNADALESSLRATPKPCLAIAGGVDKNDSIQQIAESLARHARFALLMGRDGQAIGDALNRLGYLSWEYVATLEDAVRRAKVHARVGETVVLAPGCASFDQFRNFAHRGEEFKRIVREVNR